MLSRLAFVGVLIVLIQSASAQDPSLAKAPAYPISLLAEEVRECSKLEVQLNGLTIETGPVILVPISCEMGITGAVVIGNGKFRFSTEGLEPIEGRLRSAVLRFNTGEWETLVRQGESTKVTDIGSVELSRTLLKSVMGRCWHRGADALLPPAGTLAVSLYSQEHGDLFISTDKKTVTVFNITKREMIYEKK